MLLKRLWEQLKMPERDKDKIIKDLLEKNKNLQDEVDSLWMMLDEMTKSDIENWSSILEELNASVAERMLMVTKKKADA